MTDLLSVPGKLGLASVFVGCNLFFAHVHAQSCSSLSAQSSHLSVCGIPERCLKVVPSLISRGDHWTLPDNPSRWNGTAKIIGSLFRVFHSFIIIISEFATPFAALNAVALCTHSCIASMSGSLKACTAHTLGYILVYPVRATPLALSLISKVCLSLMWPWLLMAIPALDAGKPAFCVVPMPCCLPRVGFPCPQVREAYRREQKVSNLKENESVILFSCCLV